MPVHHVIDDATPDRDLFPMDKGRGLDLSRRGPGYVNGEVADPFPAELVIPRSDWQAMIAEQEAAKTRIPDLCDYFGVKVKDQQQTNYCWVNSPTHATEIVRAIQNQAHVSLSAASVGAQVTNYANRRGQPAGVGRMGLDALKWISTRGIIPTSLWPTNEIDPSYATAAAEQESLKYRVDEWWECDPGNLDEVVSCMLRGFPVCVGLNWWGHEVTYVAPLWLDGDIAILFDNSWGEAYGTAGRGVLQGRRMLPSDAVVPRTAYAA
jgi:hypothetical protein